jgi:hypothetical protein
LNLFYQFISISNFKIYFFIEIYYNLLYNFDLLINKKMKPITNSGLHNFVTDIRNQRPPLPSYPFLKRCGAIATSLVILGVAAYTFDTLNFNPSFTLKELVDHIRQLSYSERRLLACSASALIFVPYLLWQEHLLSELVRKQDSLDQLFNQLTRLPADQKVENRLLKRITDLLTPTERENLLTRLSSRQQGYFTACFDRWDNSLN